MIKEEYSLYKIVHHYDKILAMQQNEPVSPVQIHLVPSNRCNESCSFCSYRMKGHTSNQKFSEKDIISSEKIYEIIDSCVALGVKAIQFTGGGEPLVHPNIKSIIRRTKEKGLDVGLVTNGLFLDDELIDILSDVVWVRISLDAANAETYSQMRGTKEKNFYRVIDSVASLADYKKTTVLGVGFVVNVNNYKEIYESAKICKERGVDNFRISALFNPRGLEYFSDFHEHAKFLAQRCKIELEDDDFTVFNLYDDRIKDMFEGKQEYSFCPMKDFVPYVGADLNVYTCCMYAYNDKGLIGSIQNRSFEELWHSEEKKKFYDAHDPRKVCQIPCMFQRKNEFINYCMKKNPKHVNFV